MANIHKARNPSLWVPGRQPALMSSVDAGSEFAAGLCAAYLTDGCVARNALNGLVFSAQSGHALTSTVTAGGVGVGSPGNNSTGIRCVDPSVMITYSAATIFSVIVPTFAGIRIFLYADANGSPFPSIGLAVSGGGTQVEADLGAGGSTFSTVSPVSLTKNAVQTGAMTYDGSNLRVFMNGSQRNSTAASGSCTVPAANAPMIGNYDTPGTPGGQSFGGVIHFIGVWKRALSPAEIQSLDADPYQFLIPPG